MEDRFWSKVDRDGPVVREGLGACWIWTGGRHRQGYGVMYLGGRRVALAHRVAWQHERGEIPAGLHVCHRCDNPTCVRPDHLFLGTHTDNMDDMTAKGRRVAPSGDRNGSRTCPERLARGERHGKAKLTDAQVRAMRERYAMGGVTQAVLAHDYGIGKSQASALLRQTARRDA